MNRKIKAYQAITYIVLFYLAAVLFLLGPGKLLEKDRLLAGTENPVGTVYIGLATRTGVQTFRLSWTANKTRGFIREASASFALREALRAALQLTPASQSGDRKN